MVVAVELLALQLSQFGDSTKAIHSGSEEDYDFRHNTALEDWRREKQ